VVGRLTPRRSLERLGRFEDAVAAFRDAIRLRPGYLNAHIGQAATLRRQGKWAEEAAAYADALRIWLAGAAPRHPGAGRVSEAASQDFSRQR